MGGIPTLCFLFPRIFDCLPAPPVCGRFAPSLFDYGVVAHILEVDPSNSPRWS